MTMQLRLSVDQVSTAILLLSQNEKRVLEERIPLLLRPTEKNDDLEVLGWLHAAESAFSFFDDPEEDVYNDLIPNAEGENL